MDNACHSRLSKRSNWFSPVERLSPSCVVLLLLLSLPGPLLPNEQWSGKLHHGPWACQASCCSPAPTQVLTSAASSCLRDASAMTSAVTTAVVLVNAAACRVWSPLLLLKVQLANVVFAGSGLTQRQMWNGHKLGTPQLPPISWPDRAEECEAAQVGAARETAACGTLLWPSGLLPSVCILVPL